MLTRHAGGAINEPFLGHTDDPPGLFQEAIRLRPLYLAVRRFQSDGYHDGDYASHAAWTYP